MRDKRILFFTVLLISFVSVFPLPYVNSESGAGFLSVGLAPLVIFQTALIFLSEICEPLARRRKNRNFIMVCSIWLAMAQSCAMVAGLCKKGSVSGFGHATAVVTCLFAGSCGMILAVRFLDTKMNGQGFTVMLTALILSRLPRQVNAIAGNTEGDIFKAFCVISVLVAAVAASVLLAEGYIPLGGGISMPVNPTGILPAIFAFTVAGIIQSVLGMIFPDIDTWLHGTPGLLLYSFLIICLSFYFLPVMVNTEAIAQRIRREEISGIKEGEEIGYVWGASKRAEAIGVAILVGIIIVPMDIFRQLGIQTQTIGLQVAVITTVVLRVLRKTKQIRETEKENQIVFPNLRSIISKTLAILFVMTIAWYVAKAGNMIGGLIL